MILSSLDPDFSGWLGLRQCMAASLRVQSTQLWGICGFYTRNCNNGFGGLLCIWVLGPLGFRMASRHLGGAGKMSECGEHTVTTSSPEESARPLRSQRKVRFNLWVHLTVLLFQATKSRDRATGNFEVVVATLVYYMVVAWFLPRCLLSE